MFEEEKKIVEPEEIEVLEPEEVEEESSYIVWHNALVVLLYHSYNINGNRYNYANEKCSRVSTNYFTKLNNI